jgi:radical SAM superfamily enzyme YgiQ (UPF0313 family)
MNILLIDPSIGTGDGLNTGLGWLASSLEKAGHGARVLDLVNRPFMPTDETADMIISEVKRLKPAIIGFCIHSITLNKTAELVRCINPVFDGQIIIGGPQMAFEQENIFQRIPETDFGIIGEAEKTLPELLDSLSKNSNNFSTIDGLLWKNKSEIIKNNPRAINHDISSLPYPNYKKHFGLESLGSPYSIMTSRGCPYGCVFCNPSMSGNKWRTRELKDVIDELKYAIGEYSIKEFMVQEPVFNFDPKRVIEFCSLLREHKINLPWFSPSGLRADKLTPDSLRAMKDAGCTEIKIGIESLVPDVFKSSNKGTTIDKITDACKMIKESGFPLRGSFIIGLPGDTFKKTMQSFEFSKKLGFATTDWSLLIPYPGTKAYQWVLENGTIINDYNSADQGAFQITKPENIKLSFETKDFTAEERIKAFNIISVKSGNYIFNRNHNFLKKSISIILQIIKHDAFNIFNHIIDIQKRIKESKKRGASKADRYIFSPLLPFEDNL